MGATQAWLPGKQAEVGPLDTGWGGGSPLPVGGRPLYQVPGQYPHIEVRKWPYKKQQVQPKAGGGRQDGPSDQEVKQESSKTETRLTPTRGRTSPFGLSREPAPLPSCPRGPSLAPAHQGDCDGRSSPTARPSATAAQALSSYPGEKGQGALSHRPDNCCPELEARAPTIGSIAQ